MVFEKNQLIPVVAGTRKTAIPISIDTSKSPMQIEIRNPGKSEATLGIFELKGKTLKICYSEPGKDRPTAWESKPGSRVFFMTLTFRDDR